MQAIGFILVWAGYTGVYWAIQLTNSRPNYSTGTVLYWGTGISSMGAPGPVTTKQSNGGVVGSSHSQGAPSGGLGGKGSTGGTPIHG